MARVFLDANFYFDLAKRAKERLAPLKGNLLFISPLSAHILFYTFKLKIPDKDVNQLQEHLGAVPLTEDILSKSLEGPTQDFGDNVQLHSAVEADCDFFLTSDQKLLKMKFFGKVRIVSDL